ncbi:TonB-dependent receptor [Noviluteimonas dokdonensis]|nr:TonB-dependent receptor [Lysobacter dokdonensis]
MKRKTLSLAIACAMLPTIAWAQDAQPAASTQQETAAKKTTTLESVTVTARKREETLQEVPVAVTAFTSDALDKLQVEDLGDLDAQVPNLTVYAARGSSSTITAYIRGVGQSDPLWGVDPGVGIYMDDVYIARPQGGLLDVFDVERVEVLRGPQGTLYGKNTIGGAIKYVSRPLTPDMQGFGSVTLGNYGQRDFKAGIGGGLGGNDALRARVAVADMHRNGFGENLVTGDDVSDKDVTAFRLSVGAFVTDDFDLQFNVDHVDDTSGVRAAQMLAPNPFAPSIFAPNPNAPENAPLVANRFDVRNGMPNINDTTMLGMSVTANYKFNDDWTFKYVWAKRESDTETNIDFDTLQSKTADVKAFYSDQQTTHELQVNYDAGGRVHGVMGIYSFDGYAGGQVLNNFFNLSFGDTHGTVYTQSTAVYADWTFDITEKFSIDAGVRYTDEDKHAVVTNQCYSDSTFTNVANCAGLGTPIAAGFDRTINFKNTSPKISLDYQVTDDIMAYALASRGFKSGGYNIRAQATAVPRSAEPFEDEQVDSYEIGAKMGFLDQSLFLNAAYFYNKYDDMQLSVFTEYTLPNGTRAFFGDFTNAGAGTVQGVELEYQWLANEHFTLSGNLAWLDAQFDEYLYKGFNIADQQEFTNAPEFSGAVNLEYRTPVGDMGELSARLTYSYQSEVTATTEVTRDPVTNVRTTPITQDGYGLVNAGVTWAIDDHWSVIAQGTNLTDKEFLTTGYVIPALGVRTGFYGNPRQYSLTVKYNF